MVWFWPPVCSMKTPSPVNPGGGSIMLRDMQMEGTKSRIRPETGVELHSTLNMQPGILWDGLDQTTAAMIHQDAEK